MDSIDDPYVMNIGTFLNKYAPIIPTEKQSINNPNKLNEMEKKLSSQFKLEPKVRIELINKLSDLISYIIQEGKVQAKDMAEQIGISGTYLSQAKNKRYPNLSDFMVAVMACSFDISVPGFDADKQLGEFRFNGVKTLRDYKLGSNLYHVLVNEYKGGNTVVKDIKTDSEQKTLFEAEINNPSPAPTLGKSIADVVKAENTDKPEPRKFSAADHMPKEINTQFVFNSVEAEKQETTRLRFTQAIGKSTIEREMKVVIKSSNNEICRIEFETKNHEKYDFRTLEDFKMFIDRMDRLNAFVKDFVNKNNLR